MSIHEALTDLRDELKSGTEATEAVEIAAEEHGLNPALVLRKFTESFGVTPAVWQEAHLNKSASQERADKMASLKVAVATHNRLPGAKQAAAANAAYALAKEVGVNLHVRRR